MDLNFTFFFNSIILGVGLAMDAFSVSLANGLNEPKMRKTRVTGIAAIFSLFQFAMPMIGWICVCTVMQYEGIKNKDSAEEKPAASLGALLIQGIATSIDALSVGFTIADYNVFEALFACLLIGVVTFFICFAGIEIGKRAGTALAGKAGIFGGAILIFIGLEIFITGVFF